MIVIMMLSNRNLLKCSALQWHGGDNINKAYKGMVVAVLALTEQNAKAVVKAAA